ncbi:MAG: hypothetical protein BGO29_14830 [Bacteroidales bacterium 36-12]|nr:MAG: hypothetical protein BGO29_14830 [Bacteroidales bacterium 36-12]
MNISKQPPAIHTAFNPIIIELQGPESEAEITIQTSGQSDVVLSGEFFNGKLVIDLSTTIKKLLSDKLILDYLVIIGEYTLSLAALNAVVQIGESSNYAAKRGTFRTNFERIYLYEGYENNLYILGYPETTYINFNGELYELYELYGEITSGVLFFVPLQLNKKYVGISNDIIAWPLENNAGDIILTNAGEIIYVKLNNGAEEHRILLETRCIPDSPFYVRWLNQQGGFDYWMFSYRQYHNRSVSSPELFKPVILDQSTAIGTDIQLMLEGNEKIIAGSVGLTDNQYEVVSKLIYSPRIDYYDKGIWKRIAIDKGEVEKDTRMKSQSLEFTFKLPDPQLQF